MGLRFKLLSILFLIALLVAQGGSYRPFGNVADVFIALFFLLVLCAIALWPNSSRADRVDRVMSGESWADRIEFEKSPDRDRG